MRAAGILPLYFAALLISRLIHAGIVWVEEAYPAAAALAITSGRVLYRDLWFDKPPLTPYVHLLWGAQPGWPARVGAAFILWTACWAIYRFAHDLWGEREGLLASALLCFSLIFWVPSALMALAPDLLMVPLHIAAVWLASCGRPFASGLIVGVAFAINVKALLILAVCVLWNWRVVFGFVPACALQMTALAVSGAWPAYWQQVWVWGAVYARNSFVEQPVIDGLRRTAAWAGFHATLVVGALWYFIRERDSVRLRIVAWLALSLVGVAAGARFFPRYYFQLLPVFALAAARGLAIAPRAARAAMLLLLLIPAARFGPRYLQLAFAGPSGWSDLDMANDSRTAAEIVNRYKRPGDSLLVWGYRPDIFVLTRLAPGTRFLDSQPVTGAIADRHLRDATNFTPELAARHRAELAVERPTFIVDGLGSYNPTLALTRYPDLHAWLTQYEQIGRTQGTVIYRLSRAATQADASLETR